MDKVTVKDKTFAISIPADQLDVAVKNVARKVNDELKGKDPLFLVVLNGAFMFASDLVKKVEVPCEISFVKVASYEGTSSTHTMKKKKSLHKKRL